MKKANRSLQKLLLGYRFIAVTLLSVLIVFLIFKAVLFCVSTVKDSFSSDPVTTKYGNATVRSVYQDLNDSEIETLLRETWSRPYVYEPFTQFQERPFRGDYVNVDKNGFRITKNQGPWPPKPKNLNIFLFGGSTTFGYGVPDHQTVASYLQEHLRTRGKQKIYIYNFGRGHYYSTQERILYEELIASGFIPDMAIFIDGLNDFYYYSNEPLFTPRFRKFVARGKGGTDTKATPIAYNDPKVIHSVIERYLSNKKLIEAVSKFSV